MVKGKNTAEKLNLTPSWGRLLKNPSPGLCMQPLLRVLGLLAETSPWGEGLKFLPLQLCPRRYSHLRPFPSLKQHLTLGRARAQRGPGPQGMW